MTVEYQETRFGKQVGQPQPVSPGTREWLDPWWVGLVSPYRTIVGKAIKIESDEKVTTGMSFGAGVVIPETLVREQINEANLVTSPLVSLKDTLLWRRRHYSWRPSR